MQPSKERKRGACSRTQRPQGSRSSARSSSAPQRSKSKARYESEEPARPGEARASSQRASLSRRRKKLRAVMRSRKAPYAVEMLENASESAGSASQWQARWLDPPHAMCASSDVRAASMPDERFSDAGYECGSTTSLFVIDPRKCSLILKDAGPTTSFESV